MIMTIPSTITQRATFAGGLLDAISAMLFSRGACRHPRKANGIERLQDVN